MAVFRPMFVITHALSPVIVMAVADTLVMDKRGVRGEGLGLRGYHYVAIALAGAMPDLLNPHLSLAARYVSWSHSLWALAGFLPLALLVGRLLHPHRGVFFGSLMAGAFALHLFCDAISGGIAWLYPVDPDAIVGLRLVPYASWLYLDFACLLVTALLAARARQRRGAQASGAD